MLEVIEKSAETSATELLRSDVKRVSQLFPPLWDLNNYVAVNPFLGYTSRPLADAAEEITDGLGAKVLPGLDYYRVRWAEGAFGPSDLALAASRVGMDSGVLENILEGRANAPFRPSQTVLTFAERLDRQSGTEWHDAIIRNVARWCAVYASGGGSAWRLPDDGQGLYASWLESAKVDRCLEIAGLRGWRAWARSLPKRPLDAISAMLDRVNFPEAERPSYLYRLLGGLYGWASFFRRPAWKAGGDDPGALVDLLAIRICCDAAVGELLTDSPSSMGEISLPDVEDESVRLVFQDALEDAYARSLIGRLARPAIGAVPVRPSVQAVFCIDVRSEVMRRHFEAQDIAIETRGFAGFFGVTLDWHADDHESARCPVLLNPGVCIKPSKPGSSLLPKGTIKTLQLAPGASFSFVEMMGLAYGIGLVGDALTATPDRGSDEGTAPFSLDVDGRGAGLSREARLDTACGILKNMGLRTSFARIVLLCGHEGHSANNPHAAGLDCGACGGHGGAINARVASAILNDPVVRRGLIERGWNVPADTHFLPAVHDTTTDEVTLLDIERAPTGHKADIDRLKGWLSQAGNLARAERAGSLGLASEPIGLLDRLLRKRSRDWSEVRPEWALARNAAFIAARRSRTRGVDLQGRSFLHEYDCTTDPDDSILTLILSAPMVVASWINLQYFASTVDNDAFGCGTKTIHNRVGNLGVVLGNGGDLRTGLALQSVHMPNGTWYHEPLRLQVIVESDPSRIEGVLNANPKVRDLVENGWVRLFALDPDSERTTAWIPGKGWELFPSEMSEGQSRPIA